MPIYEMAQKIIPVDNNETGKLISDSQSRSNILANRERYQNAMLVVGLEMSSFEMAQHEDFHYTVDLKILVAAAQEYENFFHGECKYL